MKKPTPFTLPKLSVLILLALVFTACENETYDTGDGKYSYLRADFGEIRTGAAATAIGGTTDEGETLLFSSPYTTAWAAKADTTYRALIYYKYNNVETDKVEPQAISRVPVVKVYYTARPDTVKFDPLTLESVWMSKNKKYLNIAVILKTGQAEGIDALQTIGLMYENEATLPGDKRELRLRFIHNQAGVPQYYSSRTFVSLPLKNISADFIAISIPTYDGWISRTLQIRGER